MAPTSSMVSARVIAATALTHPCGPRPVAVARDAPAHRAAAPLHGPAGAEAPR